MPTELIKTSSGPKWRWVKMIKGRRYRSLAVYLRKEKAEEALAVWWAEFQSSGTPPAIPTATDSLAPSETVVELLNRRLDYLKDHGSSRHRKDTEGIFKRAMQCGHFWETPATELTSAMVLDWARQYRDLVSAKAANRAINYLSTAFNAPWESARATREFPNNPFLIPFFSEQKTVPYVPSTSHVCMCLWASGNDEKDLFLRVLWASGARQGEARRLRRADVEPGRGLLVLYTRKKRGGHRTPRRVPVGKALAKNLLEFTGDGPDDGYIFKSANSGHRTKRWALNTQNEAVKACGIKSFSCHGYRHWRACEWAREGLRLSQIKARLGHETLQVTEQYLRSLGVEVENLQV